MTTLRSVVLASINSCHSQPSVLAGIGSLQFLSVPHIKVWSLGGKFVNAHCLSGKKKMCNSGADDDQALKLGKLT